MVSKLMITI